MKFTTTFRSVVVLLLATVSTRGMAQQTEATSADSAGVATAIGKYIHAHYKGRIGVDSSLACNSGNLCVDEEKGSKPQKEISRLRFSKTLRTNAGAQLVSRSTVGTCEPVHSQNCRLDAVDLYFRIYQPTFVGNSARVAFGRAGTTTTNKGTRVYDTAEEFLLSKKNGRWVVDSTTVTAYH